MDEPIQLLRLTISSGEGKDRVRQAVIMRGAFKTLSANEHPSLFAYQRALNALHHWIEEHHPERADWTLMEDRPMHWPPEWRDDEDA